MLTPSADRPRAVAIRDAIPRRGRHRWFGSFNSSQALAQSVFGAIRAFDRLELLTDLRAECGSPAFLYSGPAQTLRFEHKVESLGERGKGRTSADVFLEGQGRRVAVECKLTEENFGRCSRPEPRPGDPSYDEQFCDRSSIARNTGATSGAR